MNFLNSGLIRSTQMTDGNRLNGLNRGNSSRFCLPSDLSRLLFGFLLLLCLERLRFDLVLGLVLLELFVFFKL